MIRRAPQIYPDDIRFRETQLYVRHNRAAECPFKVDDTIPEKMEVFNLDNQPKILNDLLE